MQCGWGRCAPCRRGWRSSKPPSTFAQDKGKGVASTPAEQGVAKKVHRLVLQVNSNEPATMNLALNNATNVEQCYKERGEKVEIEIVTFGPGPAHAAR
jgi:uncharacterized protein